VAWYNANASGTTHTAATKEPNACGVYDMSGNVWEWIQDKYSSFTSSPATDPIGATSGVSRVIRGGSWNNLPSAARVANRNEQSRELLNNTLGIRLVRTSP
jgi:formylglycine-generating enzyme required for sulfatase activity